MKKYSRVFAKIDLGAVRNNFPCHERKTAGRDKNNRRGKGGRLRPRSRAHCQDGGTLGFYMGFAAATVEEAVELRLAGIKKPILILGCVFEEDYEKLTAYGYAPRFFSCPRPENCPKRLSGPELRFRCTWRWIRG